MEPHKPEHYNMRLGLEPGKTYKIIHSGHPHFTYTARVIESTGPGRIKVEYLKKEGPAIHGPGRMNYRIDNKYGQMLTQMIQSAEPVEKKGGRRRKQTRKSRKGRKGTRKGVRKVHRKSRRSNRK